MTFHDLEAILAGRVSFKTEAANGKKFELSSTGPANGTAFRAQYSYNAYYIASSLGRRLELKQLEGAFMEMARGHGLELFTGQRFAQEVLEQKAISGMPEAFYLVNKGILPAAIIFSSGIFAVRKDFTGKKEEGSSLYDDIKNIQDSPGSEAHVSPITPALEIPPGWEVLQQDVTIVEKTQPRFTIPVGMARIMGNGLTFIAFKEVGNDYRQLGAFPSAQLRKEVMLLSPREKAMIEYQMYERAIDSSGRVNLKKDLGELVPWLIAGVSVYLYLYNRGKGIPYLEILKEPLVQKGRDVPLREVVRNIGLDKASSAG